MHLLGGQGPARPVGEAVGLVGPVAGDALDQLVVGDAVAIAEHHGRHLGVEDRMRDGAGLVPDDLDVLAGGVKHLQHGLIAHQVEERLEVDAFGQRVDNDRFLRARHLHDAKQGVVGRFPQELGIYRDDGVFCEPGAGRRQLGSGSDQIHVQSMTRPTGVLPKALICQGSCGVFMPGIFGVAAGFRPGSRRRCAAKATETAVPVDVQWCRTRPDGRRPDGTASTARHNATIASPMNSNANASMTKFSPMLLDLSGSR